MRTIDVPKPFTYKQQLMGPQGVIDRDVTYTFHDFVVEHAWPYGKWNTDEAWQDAQIRIGDVMQACFLDPDKALELEDMDAEKLREAVTASPISGPQAPRLRRMQLALTRVSPPR